MSEAVQDGNRKRGVTASLRTERLLLIPGRLDISEAELGDRGQFQTLLVAEVIDWPPPLNDENSARYMRDLFRANPEAVGWGVWYFLLSRPSGPPLAIGNGGFKGVPDGEGTVEVGYSILEAYQRQGMGSEAVGALVEWAFRHPQVTRVVAQTLPELTGSIRVLEKLGFCPGGPGSEAGVLRFERLRAG